MKNFTKFTFIVFTFIVPSFNSLAQNDENTEFTLNFAYPAVDTVFTKIKPVPEGSVPGTGIFPGGKVTLSFNVSASTDWTFPGDDGVEDLTFNLTLSKLNPSGIVPTGAGAALFNWNITANNINGVTKPNAIMLANVKYPIVFALLPITANATVSQNNIGFIANILSPIIASGNNINNDETQNNIYTSAPLAIDLYKFGGFATQEGVDVFWATSEESNNMFFDVQKSSNGINFETIGKVYGSGNSKKTNNYSFVDKNAVGINYYRLKYVEFDGTVGYSKKIKVSTDGVSSNLTLNPSFVSVGNVLVNNLTDAEQTIKTIKVYNSIGQIVPVPFTVKNSNSISFDSSNLLSGNYFV